jgi:alpha 1,3-glucosidase
MKVLVWLLLCSTVFAVKDYLFKKCSSSGFCHRNQHFAHEIAQKGADYRPIYSIDKESLAINHQRFIIEGNIVKMLPNQSTRTLPFTLSLVEDNIRFTVDEKRPELENVLVNSHRYNGTGQVVLRKGLSLSENVESKLIENGVKFQFNGDFEAELQFFPIRLIVSYQGTPQLIVNNDNLLNMEHWRSREDPRDDHLHPEESDYDLFLDSFADSKDDTLPLGPEAVAVDFTFKHFNHLYGIPEHADSLELQQTSGSEPYRLYNVDIFEYEVDSRLPMYGSIPLLIASKPELSIGIFWINSADTFIDIDKSTDDSRSHWISENGVIDFIIFIDKSVSGINKKYGSITGYPQLPQLFSLGYHQCRWNYNDEKDVLDVSENFDKHQIPYDTIWLDIEYAASKKYFTWNEETFPNPEHMLKVLDRTGRNLVVIVDPHIKTGYDVSNELIEQQLTINDNTNKTYFGHCWPGESVWIDTFNDRAKSYWDTKFAWATTFMGGESTNIHLWNDMNEPSVFNGPETSAPRDTIHSGNWEHRSVHNLYGLTNHEATFESLKKRLRGHTRERPFILTRSYYSGSQKTAAMWTGDNMSKWEYLKYSIPMLLTSNVVGMPFAGADVGGFFGNPSNELLTRWYQTGIWYPFFRAHAHIDSRRREPWIPGDPYTSIIRNVINLRYSLLPVFYTAFFESSKSGSPIMKPLFYETPENLETYSIDDQFYLGDSGILVKPVTEENGEDVDMYIPDTEIYYDFTNGKLGKSHKLDKPGHISMEASLEQIPMMLKGGSILARKERYRRSSKLMYKDPYTLYVALNDQGGATGSLYIDDGESYDYESGNSIFVNFEAISDKITAKVVTNSDYASTMDDVVIEKIIVGSRKKLTVGEVVVNQGEESTCKFSLSKNGQELTILNPKIKISSGWTIDLKESGIDHDEL